MTYKEIIVKGFRVANHNLAVLLTQSIAGIAMLIVFLLLSAGLVLAGIGSLPKLSLEGLSPDNLSSLIQVYFSLILVALFMGFIFVFVVVLITAYVNAGNLGCIIQTAKGESQGFKADTFFTTGRKFMFSMLGLYIIFGLICLGAFLVFAAVGGIGFEAILMPLKESGKGLTAFFLGVPFFIVYFIAGLLVLFFLYGGWTFSGIILISEKKGAFASLSHAYSFIRRHFWDALLFTLLMFVLVFVAYTIFTKFMLPTSLSPDTNPAVALALLPLILISILLQMYVGLIARSCFTVYYISRTWPETSETPEETPEETPGDPVPSPLPGGGRPLDPEI